MLSVSIYGIHFSSLTSHNTDILVLKMGFAEMML